MVDFIVARAPAIPHITRLSRLLYAKAAETDALSIPGKQLTMLAFLRDRGALPQQDLCGTMKLSQNTIVAWLNELEDAGLIARSRDPDDRRKHNVEITPAGLTALERGERELFHLEEQLLSGLTADEHATVRRLLAKAIATAG
jgi:DNA-binding MarR family transcriptional regulator